MSRGSSSDIAQGCTVALAAIILFIAISFGVDCLLAQCALWVAGSWHVIVGFWQMFWTVYVLSLIITVAAAGAVKSAQK